MDCTSSIVNTLVNEGIIGFDTAMTVTGQPPILENNLLPADIKMKSQPNKDCLEKQDESLSVVKNPLWKKVIFGALAICGLAYGGYKAKHLYNVIKNFFKKTAPTIPTTPPPITP